MHRREAKSRRCGRAIAEAIEARVFLSATPLNQPTAIVQVPFTVGPILADRTRDLVYVVDATDNKVLAVDTDLGRTVAQCDPTATINNLAVSQDGSTLFVSEPGAFQVETFSLPDLQPTGTLPTGVAMYSIADGANHHLFGITQNFAGDIVDVDDRTGVAVTPVFDHNGGFELTTNNDGTLLYCGLSGGPSITAYDISGDTPASLPGYNINNDNPAQYVVDSARHRVYAASGGIYGIAVTNTDTDSQATWFFNEAYGDAVAVTPDDNYVIGASGSGSIFIFNDPSGLVLGKYSVGASVSARGLAPTPNDHVLFTEEYGGPENRIGIIGLSSLNIADVPQARFTATQNGTSQKFTFDARSSTPFYSGESITNYAWDFGDGTTGSGAMIDHTFPASGTYKIHLTVTSSTGQTDDVLVRTAVNSILTDAGGPYFATEGEPLQFSATAVPTAGRTIVSYEWDFNYDGQNFTTDATGAKPSLTEDFGPGSSRTVALRVTDDQGNVGLSTAALTVTPPPNQPPNVVIGPNEAVDEGAGATVIHHWLQSVDSGAANESWQTVSLAQVIVSNPGLFAVQPTVDLTTGDLSFTPAANAFGQASVSLVIQDSGDGDNTTTSAAATITINPQNHAPVAVDDSYSTGVGQTLTNLSVANSSLNISGFNYVYYGTSNWTDSNITISTSSNGNDNSVSLSFSQGGWWYYYPTFMITLTAPGGAPLTAGYYSNVARDGTQSASQAGLLLASQTYPSTVGGYFIIHQITFNSDGTLATLNADIHELVDGSLPLDATVRYHVPSPAGVVLNDTDADSDPLVATLITNTSHGALTLNADGSFTYTPDSDFIGTDSFTYLVSDGQADSNVATATILVQPVNSNPTITPGPDQTVLENSGAVVVHNWLVGVSPGPAWESGQTVSLASVMVDNPSLFSVQPTVDLTTGDLTFTPASNAFGSASITLVVQDDGGTANGGNNTTYATPFNIFVTHVNQQPNSADDSYTVQAGQSVTTDTSGSNELDVGGSTYTDANSTFSTNNYSATNSVSITVQQYGYSSNYYYYGYTTVWSISFTVPFGQTLQAGTYTYTGGSSFGQPSFSLTDSSGNNTTASGTFTIHAIGFDFNYYPTLQYLYADFHQVSNDGSTIDGTIRFNYAANPKVLANDTDPENDALTARVVSGVQHGTLNFSADGSFTYTPNSDFRGTDSFTYLANDGQTDGNLATVTFNVVGTPASSPPQQPPPVATILGATSVDEGASISLVAGNPGTGNDGVTYEWDSNYSGDGFTADSTGASFTLSASALDGPGTVNIALRVTDNTTGLSTITQESIEIRNVAPVATFFTSHPGTSTDPQIVGFYSASDSPADMQAGFTYSYDFDNDGFFEIVNSPTATAAVPAGYLSGGGTHTLHGRIADKDGAYTDYSVDISNNSSTIGNPTGNPTGNPGGDQNPPPTITITPGGKSFYFNKRNPAVYTDSTGQRVTVTLTGPGTGEVYFTRYGGGKTAAPQIILSGTTNKTTVTFASSRPTRVASIQANSALGSITGAQVDLTGAMQIISASSIRLHDLAASSSISIAAKNQPVAMTFNNASANAITSHSTIKSLSVHAWKNSGSINAPSFGTITSAGDFSARVASLSRIGDVTIGGSLSQAMLMAPLSIGNVVAASSRASTIAAGVEIVTQLSAALTFTTPSAMIKSVTIKSKSRGVFSSTVVESPSIGDLRLGSISTSQNSNSFGVWTQSVRSLSGSSPALGAFSLKNPVQGDTPLLVDGNFEVQVSRKPQKS